MDHLAHIEALNHRYGISDAAQVVAGNGGLTKVQIRTAAVSGEIYLYGAHVTSWRPAGFEEVLFVSQRSHWQQGQPIRGGIPICFPWFRNKADQPSAPKHGFVRTAVWRLDSIRQQEDGSVTMVCVFESNDETKRLWPHEFCAAYRVTFGKTLRLELSVINTGTTSMRFEEALHTYFRIGHIGQIQIHGLDGTTYLDNMDGNRERVQSGDLVLTKQTDNAYLNTQSDVEVRDLLQKRILRTEKKNSETTVVWNPWAEGAASISDFGEEEWKSMVCAEASNVLRCPVLLGPGEEHGLRAIISAESL